MQPVYVRKEERECNGIKRESSVDAVKYVMSLPRISRRVVLPYVTYSRFGSDAIPLHSLQFIEDLVNGLVSVSRSHPLCQALLPLFIGVRVSVTSYVNKTGNNAPARELLGSWHHCVLPGSRNSYQLNILIIIKKRDLTIIFSPPL